MHEQAEIHSFNFNRSKTKKITANSEKRETPKYVRNVTVAAVCRLGFSLLIDFSSQQNNIL